MTKFIVAATIRDENLVLPVFWIPTITTTFFTGTIYKNNKRAGRYAVGKSGPDLYSPVSETENCKISVKTSISCILVSISISV